jgi:hypothetical protein
MLYDASTLRLKTEMQTKGNAVVIEFSPKSDVFVHGDSFGVRATYCHLFSTSHSYVFHPFGSWRK